MRILYSAIICFLTPFFFLRLLYRSRKAPAYRQRWMQRLAIIPRDVPAGVVWFHTVSYGEAEAAFPLIREMQNRHPQWPVLVTTTTLTGSNRVRQVLGESVEHVYLPYDLPGSMKRFVQRYRPVIGVIVETEIWPNLYQACGDAGVPLSIVNARLSERSAGGYSRLSTLVTGALSNLSLIAAQTTEDAARFTAIGAPSGITTVTGNLKFDYRFPDDVAENGRKLREQLFPGRRVWIAASTHRGEEEQILEAHREIRKHTTNALLILVPRRPERFGGVAQLCERQGYNVVRRSERRGCDPATDVFLLDSMGELKQFYAAVDVACVGGSLVPQGGHNVLEPAALGVPVLFGPHMFNFERIASIMLKSGGGIEVADVSGLAARVSGFFTDPDSIRSVGEKARRQVEANRGALEQVAGLLDRLLQGSVGAS